MKSYVVTSDGGCSGNPGPMYGSFAVKQLTSDKLSEISHLSGRLVYEGIGTNNIAEYLSLLNAVAYARQNGLTNVTFLTDSALVVNQVNGLWKVKDADLGTYVVMARQAFAWANVNGCRWQLRRAQRSDVVRILGH